MGRLRGWENASVRENGQWGRCVDRVPTFPMEKRGGGFISRDRGELPTEKVVGAWTFREGL